MVVAAAALAIEDDAEEEEDGGDRDFLMKWESLLILRGDGNVLILLILISLFGCCWCS